MQMTPDEVLADFKLHPEKYYKLPITCGLCGFKGEAVIPIGLEPENGKCPICCVKGYCKKEAA